MGSAVIIAAGLFSLYILWRYSHFFSKYIVQLIIGIPLFVLAVLPTLIIVLPFVGKETTTVPVTIESTTKFRESSFRPGKHGRAVQFYYDTLVLSTEIDGNRIVDTWSVPVGFGDHVVGDTVEGVMMVDNEGNAELALRDVVRFPFTFGQLIFILLLAIMLYISLAISIHERSQKKKSRNKQPT